MVVFPNAKINLGLHILRKRSDGFHDIETCFYPVQWQDALEILPSDKFEFTASGVSTGDPAGNLVIKAFNLMATDFRLNPVKIHLHKNIPVGAGLGGGSADCAFMIKAVCDLFNLNLSTEKMEEYARRLGSDCAFFIQNKPVLAYGKGDEFLNISIDLKGKYVIIIYPDLHVSTAEAYSGVTPSIRKLSLKDILKQDISQWKNTLVNDFEESVFTKFPGLKDIKKQVYIKGALYSSMSGSGSSIFGIFDKEISAEELELPSTYRIFTGKL
ncbi:MAG: 4-(cytidine 5'-diphospho)-2-C-methyl-D-erythritol kinase [Cytophagaceae bacterium]